MPRKKQTQTGSKAGKLVSSKNELTKTNGKDTPQVASLKVYRKGITDMTKQIKEHAISLCKENLLSVKMALMGAVREVEELMKKNREEG